MAAAVVGPDAAAEGFAQEVAKVAGAVARRAAATAAERRGAFALSLSPGTAAELAGRLVGEATKG
eukprot:5134279-Prymnesium_polylepis.1